MGSSDGRIANDKTLPEDAPPQGRSSRPSLGPYEIGAKLGAGGMGEVLLARDSRLGRDIAVKRLHAGTASDEALARFLREARIQARLDHPSIVPIHELGTDGDGQPFFTMKRLAGVTLAQRLAEPATDTRALLNAFVDVCAATELAHARGVVHRDLKPANIMLGDYREVYVLDWGVARVLDEAEPGLASPSAAADSETKSGTVIGTPLYMAPEQAHGELVGPPADVFALGAILFEILVREPLRARDLSVSDTSPARRCPDRPIAPELDAACRAALAAEPADRPTAHDLGERIQHYLDGDRDLEARRMLAAEYLARARAAIASGDRAAAMRAAGRAVGLDPDSDATLLIGSLMVEPPREVPTEVKAAFDELDAQLMRSQSRQAAFAIAGTLLFLPFFAFLHVSSWSLVLAMFAASAISTVVVAYGARQARPDNRLLFLTQMVMLALMARVVTPFLILPAIVALLVTGWSSFPARLDHPVRPLVLGALGPAIAIALELAGIVSPTWHIHGHSLELTSAAFDMGSEVFVGMLITALFATMVVGGLFLRRIALQRRAALRQLELQAWHLRKLVEP